MFKNIFVCELKMVTFVTLKFSKATSLNINIFITYNTAQNITRNFLPSHAFIIEKNKLSYYISIKGVFSNIIKVQQQDTELKSKNIIYILFYYFIVVLLLLL